MKVDVFLKVLPKHPLRMTMAQLVLQRLWMFERARVVPIVPLERSLDPLDRIGMAAGERIQLPESSFHAESKAAAAESARSPVYVVIDDDHLPIGADWLERGIEALAAHHDFAMVASWSVNGEVAPDQAMHSVPGAIDDDQLFETFGLGTPYFARRGQIPPDEFRIENTTAHDYDSPMSDRVRRHGRLGFLKLARHNHLGLGFSTVSQAHWVA